VFKLCVSTPLSYVSTHVSTLVSTHGSCVSTHVYKIIRRAFLVQVASLLLFTLMQRFLYLTNLFAILSLLSMSIVRGVRSSHPRVRSFKRSLTRPPPAFAPSNSYKYL
jgi:hypothetical protein